MSYRNHYSGSPWQQGGPPFGVSSYGQNYGGYNDQYSMMNSGYGGRNQGGYSSGGGGMYGGSGGMGQMRNMGYGGPSPSRYNDRMGGGRMMNRSQLPPRKRLPPRSPIGGPRSKRPNMSSSSDRRSPKTNRRRRDSHGGSRGRGRDHSDEDDTYNPAEPTDDASDVEFEGFEIYKCSSDEEKEPEKTPAKENGEQKMDETEGDEKKKEETSKSPKKNACYVCKVICSDEHKLKKHQASDAHTAKIEELLAMRKEKKGGDGEGDKVSDKEGRDDKRKSIRKLGNWCTVCECAFRGNFLAHRRTKEHRKKRDKKYPKCRPCRLGFSSLEEYRSHYKSEDHKVRSAEFHYLKGLASGSDDDEAAIQPVVMEIVDEEKADDVKIEDEEPTETKVKVEKTEEEAEAVKEKTDDDNKTETSDKKTEKKSDSDGKEKSEKSDTKKSRPKEPKAFGQSFVVSVQGYYCKLCHKFFKDVSIAKSKHCRSIMHSEAFKKAMAEALEQEEERQALADEQDKIDQKAAEEAELAAEIADIERSAKDAIRREVAKRKSGASKTNSTEAKVVVKEELNVKEEENSVAPAEEPKVEENGQVEPVDTSVVKEEEKASEDKSAEVLEESADGEDEGDEEPEKEVAKEEVTSSPATRRGGRRGRGRKRR